MQIDKAKLAAQIQTQKKRLAQLEQLANDPELASLLETIMVNGNGARHSNTPALRFDQPRNNVKPKKGAQLAAIKEAASRRTGPFSGYQLADEMQKAGYKFASSNPGLATIEGLKSLVKKGEVEVHHRGKGSDPTLYMYV